jgi:DNA primase
MTVEEIKRQYSMSDILMRYGIRSNGTRKNISCPFHGEDKNPSMQIFQDGYNCYSCGRNGDIFKFVQEMENCSFKDAFLSLGGTYENTKEDFSAKVRLETAKREQQKRIQAEIRHKQLKLDISNLITFYKSKLSEYEPLSDMWCVIQNNIFYLLYTWDEKYVKGSEVDVSGVIGRYSEFKHIGNNV